MKNLALATGLLFILLLSASFQMNSVQSEEAFFTCTYKLDYQPDSLNKEKKSELMLLTVTPGFSKFESQYSHFSDSIIDSPLFDQSSMDALIPYLKTGFTFKIYKSHVSKTISHYDMIGQTTYNIKQNIGIIPWKVFNEYRTIANFSCRKATASFGGRQWVAWFTTEVPISDGPYKFMGLPGLITAITDSRGHYNFSLIKLSKDAPGTMVSFPAKATLTTQAEYTLGKSTNDLQKVSEHIYRTSPTTARQEIQNFKQKQARKNNPIELKHPRNQ